MLYTHKKTSVPEGNSNPQPLKQQAVPGVLEVLRLPALQGNGYTSKVCLEFDSQSWHLACPSKVSSFLLALLFPQQHVTTQCQPLCFRKWYINSLSILCNQSFFIKGNNSDVEILPSLLTLGFLCEKILYIKSRPHF